MGSDDVFVRRGGNGPALLPGHWPGSWPRPALLPLIDRLAASAGGA